MKIYIAGKISGLDYKEVKKKFEIAKNELENKGHEVILPTEAAPYVDGQEWEEYMRLCLIAMLNCDAVYFLRGWYCSKGAKLEFKVAKTLDMKIYFEGGI